MDGMDGNFEPSSRDVRIFGVILLAFTGILGGLVFWSPGTLLGLALVLASAWIVSLLFNAEERRRQLLGALLPSILLACGLPVVRGVDPWLVAPAVFALLGSVAIVVMVLPSAGRAVYRTWMLAVFPAGWTFTCLILLVIYYALLTPVGLLIRLGGRDPMRRRKESGATSYWVKHRTVEDLSRYFRQF